MGYPIILELTGRTVLVAGGGGVARRKVKDLLRAGAKVRLVAPRVEVELEESAAAGRIEWRPRAFEPDDLKGCRMVIAATDDPRVNRRIAETADRVGIWSNVADQPELGDFSVPARFERGSLLVTVSTGGASPLLAAKLKNELAEKFGPEWGPYIGLLKRVRTVILARGRAAAENREVFNRVVEADLLGPLKAEDRTELKKALSRAAGFKTDELRRILGEDS